MKKLFMIFNIKKSPVLLLFLLFIAGCENTDYRQSPHVLRTEPPHNEISVSRTPIITIIFSEDIDPSTVTASSIHFAQNIESSLSTSQNRVTMTPKITLDYETIYTITITTDIRDRGGKQLEQNFSWSFTTVPRPPFITSINPSFGTVGTIVYINGFGFASNSAMNTVRFNGILAEIISSTPTQIITSVPLGASSGPIKVSSATGNSLSPTIFTVTETGILWYEVSSGTDQTLRSITWVPPYFIAAGDNGTILISTNGINWTIENLPSQHTMTAVGYTPPDAYVIGSGGSIFYSHNYNSWSEIKTETDVNLFDLCMNSQHRIIIGASGTILFSTDGQEWKIITSPINAWLYGITQFKSNYYIVGSSGTMIGGKDGKHWVEKNSGTQENLLAIDTSSNQLIAVGYNGTIITSSNGNIWIKQITNVTNHLIGTAYTGDEIIVVGEHGCILFSTDGESWKVQTPPTDNDLYDIAWSGSLLVAVGEKGTILVSQ